MRFQIFHPITALLILLLPITLIPSAHAQSEENEKALKYYKVLSERPAAGYLFDRFYDAWLNSGTIAGLEEFLQTEAASTESSASHHLLLAYFYSKQGESDSTLKSFTAAIELAPENPVARHQMAQEQARTLDFEGALANLENALKSTHAADLGIEMRKLQGKLLSRSGEREKAMEAWKNLIAEHPEDEDLQEDLVELQLAEGLVEEASASMAALISGTGDPYQSVVREMRLGEILQQSGDRDRALETFSKCLEQVGAGSWIEKEIYAQIEKVFRRDDDLAGLGDYFAGLIGQYPRRVTLLRRNAELLAENGSEQEAVDSFKAILDITPGDQSLREGFVELLTSLGKIKLALEQLDALAGQNPDDGEILLRKAELQHQLGDHGATTALISEFLDRSEGLEADHLRTCRLFDRYDLREEADRAFATAAERFPDSVVAREAQAAYFHKTERKQEAVTIWRDLASGGDRARVVQVGRSLASRGENKAAFEVLHNRFADFSDDPVYLGFLCQQAAGLDKFAEALPWSRKLVRLSQSANDLAVAIALTHRLADSAGSAETLINDLESSSPRAPEETCLLGELYELRGESVRADETLESIAAERPLLAKAQLIRLQENRRDWHRAAELTEEIIGLPGGRKSIHIRKLVEFAMRSGNEELALKWLPEWKKISPNSTQPWLTETQIYIDQSETDSAIRTLRLASNQFNDDTQITARLAKTYADDNQIDQAQRLYQRLYDEAGDTSAKLRWVASLAETAERGSGVKELIERFQLRRRNNRKSLTPLLALAEIYRVTEDYEKQRETLHEASRLKPDNIDLLLDVARLEEREDDVDRALETLQRAARLDDSTRIQERIARLYFSDGRETEAFAVLADIAAGQNFDPRSIESFAISMTSTQSWASAADFLKPYVEQFPQDYRLRFLRACALEEDGEIEEATELFLTLLRGQKDIPGLPLPQQQPLKQGYLAGIAPPGAIDLRAFVYNTSRVYAHRPTAPMGSYFSNRAPPVLSPPSGLEQLRHFTLAHLVMIGQQSTAKELEDLKQRVGNLGERHTHILFEMESQTSLFGISDGRFALLDKFPDDPIVNALALLRLSSGGHVPDLQQLQRAHEIFEEDYPQLAFLAAVSAVQYEGEVARGLVDSSIAIAREIHDPTLEIAVAILPAFDVGPVERVIGRSSKSFVSEDQRSALSMQLVAWIPELRKSANSHSYYLRETLRGLAKGKDLSHFADLLNNEYAFLSGLAPKSSYRIPYGQQPFLTPLPFPPQSLPGVPNAIYSLFVSPQHRGNQYLFDPAALSDSAPKIESAILRTVLYSLISESGLVAREIYALEAKDDATLAELLMAASYFGNDGEQLRALDLLVEAQSHPMDHATRVAVDSSIVRWTSIAIEDSVKTGIGPALEPATAAAMRLRKAAVSHEQRSALADAFNALGMEDEADKMQELALSTPIQTRTGSPSRVSFKQSQPSVTKRAVELLKRGKRDAALRLIGMELRTDARSWLRGNHPRSNWSELSSHEGLIMESLKSFDPGESDNPREWAEFAAAYHLKGDHAHALELFKKTLELDPGNEPAIMRYAPKIVLSDPDRALELFLKLRPKNLQVAGKEIPLVSPNSSAGEVEYERNVVDLARFCTRLLSQHENLSRYDLSWIENIAVRANNPMQIPTSAHNEIYTESSDKELSLERVATRDELNKAMLKIPQLALNSFDRYASSIDDRENPAAARALAEVAAETLLIGKPLSTNIPTRVYLTYSPRSVQSSKRPTHCPELIIAKQAFAEGDRAGLKELQVKLRRANARTAAENIGYLESLYFGDGEAFIDALKKFRKKRPSGFSIAFRSALDTAVTIWRQRQLDIDMRSILFESINAPSSQMSGKGFEPLAFVNYATEIHLRGGFAPTHEFLEQLNRKIFDSFKGHIDPDLDGQRRAVQSVAVLMGWKPALSVNTVAFVDSYYQMAKADGTTTAEEAAAGGGLYELGREDRWVSEDWIAALGGSPFFCPPGELRLYPIPESAGGTAFGKIVRSIGELPEVRRAPVVEFIHTQPDSFGKRLILAGVETNHTKMYEFLLAHKGSIERLPEERKKEFASLSYAWDLGITPNEELQILYEHYLLHRKGGEIDLREQFLALESHPDTEILGMHLVKLLRPLLKKRRDLAHQIFQKGALLWLENPPVPEDYERGESLLGQIGREIRSPDSLAFNLEVIVATKGLPVEFTDALDAGERFLELIEPGSNGARTAPRLHKSLEKFAPYIRDVRTIPLLSGAVLDYFDGVPAEKQEEFVVVFSAHAANAENPEVMLEFAKILQIPIRDEAPEHLLAYLANEEISLTARTSVFCMVFERTQGRLPTDFILASSGLIAESFEAGLLVPEFIINAVLGELATVPDRDEKWQAASHRLTRHWRPHLCVGSANVSSYLLALALASGNTEAAERVATCGNNEGVTPDIAWLQILVKHRQFDLARSVLVKHWEKISYSHNASFRFDDDYLANSAEFVASLDEPDHRFVAELLLATAVDDRLASGYVARQEREARVSEVAKKLPGMGIKFVPTKRKLLTIIADYQAAADTIPEMYTELASGYYFLDFVNTTELRHAFEDEWRMHRIYWTTLRQHIAKEGVPTVSKFVSAIAEDPPIKSGNNFRYEFSTGSLLSAIQDGVLAGLGDLSDDDLKEIAKLRRGYPGESVDRPSYLGARGRIGHQPIAFHPIHTFPFNLVIHTLADDLENLAKWRESAGDHPQEGGASPHMVESALRMLGKATSCAEYDITKRVDLILKILDDPKVRSSFKFYPDSVDSIVPTLIESRAISDEEMKTHGSQITQHLEKVRAAASEE